MVWHNPPAPLLYIFISVDPLSDCRHTCHNWLALLALHVSNTTADVVDVMFSAKHDPDMPPGPRAIRTVAARALLWSPPPPATTLCIDQISSSDDW